jgi:single-stranded-DNA-specific exonuclease
MTQWRQREPTIPYRPFDDVLEKLGKINGIENVEEFLNPGPECLHDPYTLLNIEQASNTILSAIQKGHKIGVSIDVDSDGVTSGVIILRYLRDVVPLDKLYYIHAERADGHGIEKHIDKVHEDTNLLIIVDSSSNSVDACKTLFDKGISVVILDHHPVEVENPYAIVVNPQNPNDPYENKNLSGVGVCYKVLQVMDDNLNLGVVNNFLDLVATGLVTDVMSMREMENRYLVGKGLRNIANPGLLALLKVNKVNFKNLNSQTIGFTIGPNLNGAARMGNIGLAIDLLLEDDPLKCGKLAKEIKQLNEKRKEIEAEIYERLLPSVKNDDKILVLLDDEIDKSFNGLVATKFANKFQRPAIVLQDRGKWISGSYRGYKDFDMKSFLKDFKEHMEADLLLSDDMEYGFVRGHDQAGGFEIHKADVNSFRNYANNKLKDVEFESGIEYDLEIGIDDITDDFMRQVERFSFITGKDFETPKFAIRGLRVMKRDVIGSKNDTVKMTVGDGDFVCIKFRTDSSFAKEFEPTDSGISNPFSDDPEDTIKIYHTIDVVGSLSINRFYHGGFKAWIETHQCFIDDIKEH